jgi:maleylacetate reductase
LRTACAGAIAQEAKRLDAKRVYLVVSRTLNTKTDEIDKVRVALGDRFAGIFDRMPQHTSRVAVVEAAAEALDAGADLIVAIGGGSTVDAAKIMLPCNPATADAQMLLAEALRRPGVAAADAFAEFVAELGLPRRLADVGVTPAQFSLITELSMEEIFTHTNPQPIRGAADIAEIHQLAA